MREIKFRAWVPAQQKMYGSSTLDEMQAQWSYPLHWCQPLMQYTGLKDANGVEIYEGDIVRDNYGKTGAVAFHTEDIASCGCCYTSFSGSGFAVIGCDLGDVCTVIGNIHEHPELLNTN